MKNIFKIVITVLFITILSGCTLEENITIENSGATDEKIKIYADNEYYNFQEKPISEYIEETLTPYEEQLNSVDYNYKVFSDIDNSGVELNKTFDGVCEYFNSSEFIKRLYGTINCTETDDYYEISSVSGLLTGGTESDEYILDLYDKVSFSIDTMFKITDSNADKVKNDIYTWNFEKSNTDKNINLKIAKNDLIVIENNDYVKDVKKRENNSFILTILGVGAGIIFVSLIIFILLKKYKSKRIEY